VILHGPTGVQVQGLTTAAAIWITASLGVSCGLAAWRILAVGLVLTFFLLIAVGAVERWLNRRRDSDQQSDRTGTA
jgi:putative Mg2+ transporter-C (MgtC) family protein